MALDEADARLPKQPESPQGRAEQRGRVGATWGR